MLPYLYGAGRGQAVSLLEWDWKRQEQAEDERQSSLPRPPPTARVARPSTADGPHAGPKDGGIRSAWAGASMTPGSRVLDGGGSADLGDADDSASEGAGLPGLPTDLQLRLLVFREPLEVRRAARKLSPAAASFFFLPISLVRGVIST
jgi:hypothetical protein